MLVDLPILYSYIIVKLIWAGRDVESGYWMTPCFALPFNYCFDSLLVRALNESRVIPKSSAARVMLPPVISLDLVSAANSRSSSIMGRGGRAPVP
ncbi:hypothetical protein BGLA2_610043 [Burkholderia gladioli]|nr:hypothetical protein BGLA2_610043 [Burkholderia gladioli]